MLRLAAQNGTHSRPSVNKSHCSPSHTTVSQVALVVKNPPANARDIRDAGWIPGLGRSMEEGMSTHSSVLVWRIPRTEVPGKLQSIGLQRVRHSWTSEYTPTPFCAACSPYFDSSVRSQITSFMALTWDSSWGCELLLSCSYSWVVNIATSQPWDETSHQISATKSWIPDREEKISSWRHLAWACCEGLKLLTEKRCWNNSKWSRLPCRSPSMLSLPGHWPSLWLKGNQFHFPRFMLHSHSDEFM